MIKLNKAEYIDKLHACWIGKNIGGTIGAPFEGRRDLLDVQGFTTPEGEVLPNDDLDLQLVWLSALEQYGVKNFSTNVLAEYWLERIAPNWNEYGICKSNLRLGLLPPMSGEVDNDKWKTSNGAWIRSEVWAGVAPAAPDIAIKYAIMDAMVDHGLNEGTYAEIFTASMQSAAYVESDIRKLIETGLKKIPDDCMIAKTIRLVMDCYDKGIDYRETRERVVEFNKPLGWFQAPGNLGFVVIGLLYGEGDFKKSMLYAVNCGDDTDCTAATIGATLGIIGGTKAIPEDWKSFVGDKIATLSINGIYIWSIPRTCTELTQRVANLVLQIMQENKVHFEFTDSDAETSTNCLEEYNNLTAKDFWDYSPYSYDVTVYRPFTIKVELDDTPRIRPLDSRRIKLTFRVGDHIFEQRKLRMKLILPEGWSCDSYERTIALDYPQHMHGIFGINSTEFVITAGENISCVNYVYAEITDYTTIPYPIMVPIVFVG
ncbi:MAG: ADP-ribosylglycohydrolase family protein [Candidatus Flemingiibacterium sp.]